VSGAEVRVFRRGDHALVSLNCPVCSKPLLECGDPQTAHALLDLVRSGGALVKPFAITTTGSDGAFRFDAVPDEPLLLVARAGALDAAQESAAGTDDAVLVLTPNSGFSVKVTKADWNGHDASAVPGAKVTAISLATMALAEATAGPDGIARFGELGSKSGVWVFVEAPGCVSESSTLYPEEPQTEITLSIARTLIVHTLIGGKPTEATVTVTGERQHPRVQKTQAGITRFEGLGSEMYDAFATTEAMVSPRRPVYLEEQVLTVNFELRASARILLTVIDEQGEPVDNAEVTVSGQDGDFHSETTSEGRMIVIGPVAEGSRGVTVSSEDFLPWTREQDIRPGDNPIEVVLKKGLTIRGTVLDAEGKKVPQALVLAHSPMSGPESSYTDSEGSFELVLDEAGIHELTASEVSAGTGTVRATAPSENLVIHLDPRARLRIFVHDGRTPVAGASISMVDARGETSRFSGRTGEDGALLLAGLESGTYKVFVESEDFRRASPPDVTVAEGRTLAIDVPVDRGLTIQGVVVDEEGAPVSDANVQTEPYASATRTDEAGRFTLTTLDPLVNYVLQAGDELREGAPVEIRGPQGLVKLVVKARPSIRGRVVDQLSGAPVLRFRIDSRPVDSTDGTFSVPYARSRNGPTTQMGLSIDADGYDPIEWSGDFEPHKDIGTVRLSKEKQIQGFVRDAHGNPVSGAMIGSTASSEEVTSAANGGFQLAVSGDISPLVFHARRGQLKGAAAWKMGQPLEIVLGTPTRVFGSVLDAEARPVGGFVLIRGAIIEPPALEDGVSLGNSPEALAPYGEEDEVRVEVGPEGKFTTELSAGRWVFITRLNASGQAFQISGPTMEVKLGTPPGSCSLVVSSPVAPDELMLIPGEGGSDLRESLNRATSVDGTVLFDTAPGSKVLRAAGFRCGAYSLLARWNDAHQIEPLELHSGAPVQLTLKGPSLQSVSPQQAVVH
jgi:protocatechuate 3,4-dioxygenase beta subunit